MTCGASERCRKPPAAYIERLISELGDHITDFQENAMSKECKSFRLSATEWESRSK